MDRFFGWPFVGKYGRSATTAGVVSLLKEWFTYVGAPVKNVSDGGPQFRSLTSVQNGVATMNPAALTTTGQVVLPRLQQRSSNTF